MTSPRPPLEDDEPTATVDARGRRKPEEKTENSDVTVPDGRPTETSMPLPPPVPSAPSVATAPPTVLELPLDTVGEMPRISLDNDPTTAGVPKKIQELKALAPPPRPAARAPRPKSPEPRVTASEIASVSVSGFKKRVHPLIPLAVLLAGLAAILLALNWLLKNSDPDDGPRPNTIRKRLFDW